MTAGASAPAAEEAAAVVGEEAAGASAARSEEASFEVDGAILGAGCGAVAPAALFAAVTATGDAAGATGAASRRPADIPLATAGGAGLPIVTAGAEATSAVCLFNFRARVFLSASSSRDVLPVGTPAIGSASGLRCANDPVSVRGGGVFGASDFCSDCGAVFARAASFIASTALLPPDELLPVNAPPLPADFASPLTGFAALDPALSASFSASDRASPSTRLCGGLKVLIATTIKIAAAAPRAAIGSGPRNLHHARTSPLEVCAIATPPR